MRTTTNLGLLAGGAALALVATVLSGGGSQAATPKTLTVDLASSRGPSTGVGEGFLYGMNQDASLPADQYLQPLGVTAWRAGGHLNRAWIGDGYRYGAQTQADVNSVITQARRLTRSPYHAQYQVILSDLFGLDGGQPSNTVYPCTNGDCSNWITFIDSVVGALQASGVTFAYDINNEPDISVFWPNASVNSTQYFQMWDSAFREIRRIAPQALIVGPSFAYTPQARPGQWSTWLSHVKAAGTVPDWIANHNEGGGDDPVAVAQAINNAVSAQGIPLRPLSSNEYQPADRQSTGTTAWFLARFAQSGYSNAMRGNWVCCLTPNLTGVLTQSGGTWAPNGSWWALRRYADLTGTLVNTSGQVGTTAIAAAKDSTARRAVAILGDNLGYTGDVAVTFNGLASQTWLAGGGSVKAVVERIPDQYPLSAPQVVYSQTLNATSGSLTVPLTFQASHDAFAITLTPGDGSTQTTTTTRPTTTTTGGGAGNGALVTPGGKCLGVSGSGNSSSAQIQTCNGGSGQSWSFNSDGSLRTLGGSMCLDANGRGTSNGTSLIIWSCNGGSNQLFAPGSNSSIVNSGSGRCVDVPNGSTTDGTGVQLYDCWGGDPQKWTLQGGGTTTTTTTTTTTPTTTTHDVATATTSPPPTTTTTRPTTTTTTSSSGGGPSCSATYTLIGSWGGGFQGDVKVTNTGGTVTSWNVTMNLQSGQSITSLWSGVASGSTGTVRVSNAPYNGALGSGASTSFGFTANGNATPTPSVTCSAS